MPDVNTTVESTAKMLGSLSFLSVAYALCALLICLIVKKAVCRLLDKALSRTRLDSRLSGLILKGVNAVLWFVIILIMCDRLGINITSLVALFSVVGLAFSLAIQDSLSNLAGGMTILSSRPFKIGDYVEAVGQEGTVDAIGIIYTQILTADNRRVFLPNSAVSSGKIINYSSQPNRRVTIDVSASYDDSAEKVKAALREVVEGESRVLESPAPIIAVTEYGDSAISYTVRVWVKNSDFWPVKFAMTEAVRDSFDRHGVTMTYNHINVHMMKD